MGNGNKILLKIINSEDEDELCYLLQEFIAGYTTENHYVHIHDIKYQVLNTHYSILIIYEILF